MQKSNCTKEDFKDITEECHPDPTEPVRHRTRTFSASGTLRHSRRTQVQVYLNKANKSKSKFKFRRSDNKRITGKRQNHRIRWIQKHGQSGINRDQRSARIHNLWQTILLRKACMWTRVRLKVCCVSVYWRHLPLIRNLVSTTWGVASRGHAMDCVICSAWVHLCAYLPDLTVYAVYQCPFNGAHGLFFISLLGLKLIITLHFNKHTKNVK